MIDGYIDRWMDIQIDGYIDRWIYRQIDGYIDRKPQVFQELIQNPCRIWSSGSLFLQPQIDSLLNRQMDICILYRWIVRYIDGYIDRWIYVQIVRWIYKQMDIKKDRYMYIQIDRWIHSQIATGMLGADSEPLQDFVFRITFPSTLDRQFGRLKDGYIDRQMDIQIDGYTDR